MLRGMNMAKYDEMHHEANNFALELLMPKDKFDKFIGETAQDVKSIAKYFQVPSMAVRQRAKQLGYEGHNL